MWMLLDCGIDVRRMWWLLRLISYQTNNHKHGVAVHLYIWITSASYHTFHALMQAEETRRDAMEAYSPLATFCCV